MAEGLAKQTENRRFLPEREMIVCMKLLVSRRETKKAATVIGSSFFCYLWNNPKITEPVCCQNRAR